MLSLANIHTLPMDIPTPEQLSNSIDNFIARHAMAPTRFGRDTVNDPNLISDLRAGRRLPGLLKLQRIRDFMAAKDAELAAAGHADLTTDAEARHHG